MDEFDRALVLGKIHGLVYVVAAKTGLPEAVIARNLFGLSIDPNSRNVSELLESISVDRVVNTGERIKNLDRLSKMYPELDIMNVLVLHKVIATRGYSDGGFLSVVQRHFWKDGRPDSGYDYAVIYDPRLSAKFAVLQLGAPERVSPWGEEINIETASRSAKMESRLPMDEHIANLLLTNPEDLGGLMSKGVYPEIDIHSELGRVLMGSAICQSVSLFEGDNALDFEAILNDLPPAATIK